MLFFKIHVSKAVQEGLLPMLGLLDKCHFYDNDINMTLNLVKGHHTNSCAKMEPLVIFLF